MLAFHFIPTVSHSFFSLFSLLQGREVIFKAVENKIEHRIYVGFSLAIRERSHQTMNRENMRFVGANTTIVVMILLSFLQFPYTKGKLR